MGPTKEELANYFKNNRKYFDELAQHYKHSDPEYYKKYIEPFYGISFAPIGSKRSGGPFLAIFAAAVSVLIMGIVLFFLVYQTNLDEDSDFNDEEIENETQSDNVRIHDSLSKIKELGDYEKGNMYFQLGEYDKAEKYLSKIPEDNPKYLEARKKLVEIRKKTSENK